MSRDWRLPCPECDTGYRKMHTESSWEEANKQTDGDLGYRGPEEYVRCNNCRDVHSVESTRELDVQAGVGR